MDKAIRRSSSFAMAPLFGLVGAGFKPAPTKARSITQVERFAEHLLPLLFLRVAQDSLDPGFVILADLHHFGPDLLRIAAGLGFFYQRFDLLLHFLNDAHELLPLLD